MRNIKKFKIHRPLGLLLSTTYLLLIVSGLSVSQASADSPANLCYDYYSGTVFKCLQKVDGTESPTSSDTTIQGGGSFNIKDCYTLSDINQGWVATDCNNSVFSTPISSTIPTTGDAAASCTGTGANKVCGCTKSSNPTITQPVCGLSIFTQDIDPVLDFLAAGVGIVATIMVVVGAIQYSASAGNPQAAAAAKKRIANAIIAIVAFGILYGLLQWIIPGGLFSS